MSSPRRFPSRLGAPTDPGAVRAAITAAGFVTLTGSVAFPENDEFDRELLLTIAAYTRLRDEREIAWRLAPTQATLRKLRLSDGEAKWLHAFIVDTPARTPNGMRAKIDLALSGLEDFGAGSMWDLPKSVLREAMAAGCWIWGQ